MCESLTYSSIISVFSRCLTLLPKLSYDWSLMSREILRQLKMARKKLCAKGFGFLAQKKEVFNRFFRRSPIPSKLIFLSHFLRYRRKKSRVLSERLWFRLSRVREQSVWNSIVVEKKAALLYSAVPKFYFFLRST